MIPSFTRTLSKLKRTTILLPVEIDYPCTWRVFEGLVPPVELPDVGPRPNYIRPAGPIYKLEIHRDGVLCWERATGGYKNGQPIFVRMTLTNLPELEGEVSDWLSLNPSLDTIRLLLSADEDDEDDYIDENLP
jgi:hypothetical protein